MASDFQLQLLVVVFLYVTETYTQKVTLTVDRTMPVTEGERLGFTCSVTGLPKIVQFSRSPESIVYWITMDGRCDKIQHNNTLYNATCERNKSQFYLEILHVDMTFYKNNLTCVSQYDVITGRTESVSQSVIIEISSLMTTESTDASNQKDCSFGERSALIGVLSIFVLLQITVCFVLFILHRKGFVAFNTKKRSYEDVQKNTNESQMFKTMKREPACETTQEQIYDDIRY